MNSKQPNAKPSFDPKDPFQLWGIILVGLGVAFGGLIGGACGGGAGAYIMQLSKKEGMSQSTKYAHAAGATVLGVVAYVGLAALVLGAL